MEFITQPLLSQPGIQRDGTVFSSKHYIDGQWVRFVNGRPRKMGGYKLIDRGQISFDLNGETISGAVNKMFSVSKPGNFVNIYLGRAGGVSYLPISTDGISDVEVNRTPPDLVVNKDNKWTFDLFTTQIDGQTISYICGHVCPNNTSISNNNKGKIYYGDTEDDNVLTFIKDIDGNPVEISGGIVFMPPFLLAYGDNGAIYWSKPGEIDGWDVKNDYLIVSNTKLVKAVPARSTSSTATKGNGSNPSIIVWSMDKLFLVYYTSLDNVNTFGYSDLSSNISILAPESVVKYNEIYYWIGDSNFFVFNGSVSKLENTQNLDYFFNNVNYNYASKIFGIVNKYDEIWWFYPSGDSTECDSVIIYNVSQKIFYDTKLSRSSGVKPEKFSRIVLADSATILTPTPLGATKTYPIWIHEFGFDKIVDQNVQSIKSSFTTHYINLFSENPQNSKMINVKRLQPDFLLFGDMNITVYFKNYPAETPQVLGPFPFSEMDHIIDDISCQAALVSFKFESNSLEGYYEMGNTLLNFIPGATIK